MADLFHPRQPDRYRWLGLALLTGEIPEEGRTEERLQALRRLMELPPGAPLGLVKKELRLFKERGQHRGVR